MNKIAAFIVLLLSGPPAHAYELCFANDPTCAALYQPRHYSGDGDLSRAMNICEQHSHDTGIVYSESGAPPRIYDRGWEACNAIRVKWNDGEQAKAMRERVEQERRDKTFIEDFAKQLGK